MFFALYTFVCVFFFAIPHTLTPMIHRSNVVPTSLHSSLTFSHFFDENMFEREMGDHRRVLSMNVDYKRVSLNDKEFESIRLPQASKGFVRSNSYARRPFFCSQIGRTRMKTRLYDTHRGSFMCDYKPLGSSVCLSTLRNR